jgi:hypothetical protein
MNAWWFWGQMTCIGPVVHSLSCFSPCWASIKITLKRKTAMGLIWLLVG